MFFSRHRVQTGSGAHPASYPMGMGGLFSPRVKQPGSEADHSHPPSAEVKTRGAIPPFHQYIFRAWCLVKYKGNFTFKFTAFTSVYPPNTPGYVLNLRTITNFTLNFPVFMFATGHVTNHWSVRFKGGTVTQKWGNDPGLRAIKAHVNKPVIDFAWYRTV